MSPNGAVRPGPVADEAVLELAHVDDLTPLWLYWATLVVAVVGFLWSFVFWASGSDVITPVWRFLFLALMAVFVLTGVLVSVRLSKRQRYVARTRAAAMRAARDSREFARRRRVGMARMVHEARTGVTGTARSIRSSGTHFREGFQTGKEPNFIVKTILRFVRAGVWVYLRLEALVKGLWRVVLFFLRAGLWVYVKIVQLLWALFRGIVEPVLVLAFRIVRWALGVTYRVARGTLRLGWRIVYWLVRRWPFVYATRLLEVPTRVHVAPAFLSTDVVVSEALHVPVRPSVLEAAGPSVAAFRLRFRVRMADRQLQAYEERVRERPDRVRETTPEERQALRADRRQRRADEHARRKREEREAKEAKAQAAQREKEREAEHKAARKAAEAETKQRLAKEKAAGRKLSKEDRKAIEQEVLRKHLPEAAEPEPAAPPEEGATTPKAAAKREKAAAKAEAKEEKARGKAEKQRAKEERQRAREEEKRERQATKEAEKESKPELKRRVKRAKTAGRKLDKQEQEALRLQIVEELVAKKLGREPRPVAGEPAQAPPAEEGAPPAAEQPAAAEPAPKKPAKKRVRIKRGSQESEPEAAPVADEEPPAAGAGGKEPAGGEAKKPRGFRLKRRREKEAAGDEDGDNAPGEEPGS